MDQLEKYHLGIVRDNITYTAKNVIEPMMKDKNLHDDETLARLQDDLKQSTQNSLALSYQFYIIDMSVSKIIASTDIAFVDKNAFQMLDRSVILAIRSKSTVESDITVNNEKTSYKIKHMAFLVDSKDKSGTDYIIYGKASLKNVYESLSASSMILIQATCIALLITVILGYLIAGSITVPINQLTLKAFKMAKGDFTQRVDIKSEDEIGQLGKVFNYLTAKLDMTLIEISSEKSKLNAIINHMEDAVVAVDVDGFIIHHNPMFIKLLDIPEQNLQGILYDFVIEPYSKELAFGEILTRGMPEIRESIVFETPNKQILKAYPALFRDEYGRISGAVVVIQDITESQKLENMRKEFVANVSHELKTPITTIKSYSETLLNGAMEESEMAYHFLQVIENEADRMSALVKDLLQLSQMDYNNVQWDMCRIETHSLLADCIQKMSIYLHNKKQLLQIKRSSEAIFIFGDRSKLEQVFINLISNAIKYTAEEGQIYISTEIVDNLVCIEIKDSGIGIPSEDLQHIFERFYRVDKGRSRAQGGTGLGLAIAKDIVSRHQGKIEVSSEVGKGSRFIVCLPVDNSVDNESF